MDSFQSLSSQLAMLRDAFHGAWRFRWTALAVAWAVAVLGWVAIYFVPDRYQARARVFVDTSGVLRPLLQGLAIDSGVQSQLDLVRQAMLSRPQLEKVATKTDLFARAKTPFEREELLDSLRKNILLTSETGRGNDNLYTMTYEDFDRSKSVEVIQTILDSFMEDVIGNKMTGQATAQRFLQEQIREYERRLSEAEMRLADFKKRNLGLVPGERGDYFSRLQQEQDELDRARSALRSAETRSEQLRRQLRGESPELPVTGQIAVGASGTITTASETGLQLAAAEARLQQLLLQYTEKHPEVIATRETIETLRQRRRQEVDELRRQAQSSGTVASLNPVYQRLQVALNEAEVEVASLRGDVSDRSRRIAELRKLLDTAPEVEAELARLNRDYGVTRAQYDALVQRLETARLSEDADRTGIVRFEVIDPPVASLRPVAPNRGLLIAAALVLGLGAGGAVAYARNLARPIFTTPEQLVAATGLPLAGSVGLAHPTTFLTERARDQRKLILVGSALLVAFIVVRTTSLIVTSFLQSVLR
jgi:polysaccharide chain length determinant protein (PEP-CTERM system associated)